MIPNKSSLLNKIGTGTYFLLKTKIYPKILLLPLKKCVFDLDQDPRWEKMPGSATLIDSYQMQYGIGTCHIKFPSVLTHQKS